MTLFPAPAGYTIRLATPDDIPAWRLHLASSLEENGRDGRFSAPFSREDRASRFTTDRLLESRANAALALGEPKWLRVFLGAAGSEIVGHADLNGGAIPSEMHRCLMGIGIMFAHHRRGLGEALLAAAIAWAEQQGIEHMDLGVLSGNEPALALYRKLGFAETGRVEDRFRVDGVSLADISMTRALRPA